jgi:toxin ParE1/3/4
VQRNELRLTAQALLELELQALWYESRRRGLGDEFLNAIEVSFVRLRSNPYLYSTVRGGLRRVHLRRFPFSVFFTVEDGVVVVLAIVHGRRHPRVWPVNGT